MTDLEVRTLAEHFELRELDGALHLTGYPSVTAHAYSMGPYMETIARGAFTDTLAANPDVQLLINHEGLPLARTGRNLTLTEDERGLRVDAQLNPALPRVQELAMTARDGLLDSMSFAFRATSQDWNDDYDERTITGIDLHRGDVSVVNQGASPFASFSMRSNTLKQRRRLARDLGATVTDPRPVDLDLVLARARLLTRR